MPVGPFIRRLADNDFRPEVRDKYMAAYYWMNWLIHTLGINIQHKLNTGWEVRIGEYLVDGYIPPLHPGEKAIALEFHGCYWHGHLCSVIKGIRDEKWRALRVLKYKKIKHTTALLEKGSSRRQNVGMRLSTELSSKPCNLRFHRYHASRIFSKAQRKNIILDGVVKGKLFGVVEVDIEVPQC